MPCPLPLFLQGVLLAIREGKFGSYTASSYVAEWY
jgi:hypothetical protein